jgi:cell division transport system permease protein
VIAWLAAHGRAARQAAGRLLTQPLGASLSALVIGLALALPATGLALFDSVESLASGISGAPEVSLFLKDSTAVEERARLERSLRGDAAIASLRFVPRDEARRELARNGLADVLDSLPANPLPDAYVLTLRSVDPAAFAAARERYQRHPAIEHVQLDTLWVQRLEALVSFGKLAMVLLAGLLGAALVIITFNTIRLQLLTRQEEIAVSRRLGATVPFIRRPFYWFGGLQGLAGGLFAWGITSGLLALLAPTVQRIAETYGTVFSLAGLDPLQTTALLLFATLLGLAGTALALGRHLRSA